MDSVNPNQMLVEDVDHKGVVIAIMRHFLGWWPTPDKESEYPAFIKVAHSANEVLKENGLIAQLQESSVKAVGIIVDANGNQEGR